MPLLDAKRLSLAFGYRPLLDNVSFTLNMGDKIALLGRNGEGKSTLLNVLRGAQIPDDGNVQRAQNIQIAYLPQDPPAADDRLVREVVSDGIADVLNLLERFQSVVAQTDGEELHELEAQISAVNGWQAQSRIDAILAQFELDGTRRMAELSGGWRRRTWLARVLIGKPDILLLDEPTNHLDMGAIEWLEGLLKSFAGAVIFVTHDRAFMQNVANRIWELDRGFLLDIKNNYRHFMQAREEIYHAEALAQARFDKKLAEEEQWIRQGIKARRTRNEGRVRALKEMRRVQASRVQRQGKAALRLDSGERSGQQVIVAENVRFQHPNAPALIKDFSDIIERGEKIGLVGANGVGKTTLLKVLLGELAPQQGTVQHGTRLEVAYFDQLRANLDENATLRDSLAQGSDYVEIAGQRKHIASYLQDFLFPPERWNTPVSALSGGERARLLLARLFAQPANVLILDEPTNDLDIETLELLEEVLTEYTGTVLLVSHDRAFLDAVVTRLWVFNQHKNCIEHIYGGFEDWLQQGGSITELEATPNNSVEKPIEISEKPAEKAVEKASGKVRLSYKYQRELEEIPAKIESIEATVLRLSKQVQEADFYEQSNEAQTRVFTELQNAQQQLDQLMDRWMQLENGEI